MTWSFIVMFFSFLPIFEHHHDKIWTEEEEEGEEEEKGKEQCCRHLRGALLA